MKPLNLILTALVITTLTACGSNPPKQEVSKDNITVRFTEEILNEPRKQEAMEEYEIGETILRYIHHRFQKLKVRKSLRFNVYVTGMRIKMKRFSGGSSTLETTTKVMEHGKLLKEVVYTSTFPDKHQKAVNLLSKDTAINLYENIKDL